MSKNNIREKTRRFGIGPFVAPVNQTHLSKLTYFNLFPSLTSGVDNDFMADRLVRMNFFKTRNTGNQVTTQLKRVLPFGLKRKKNANGDFVQSTGTCGDSSDHIRMVKIFGRMKFNN